jgi:type IV pilus assembly protein PilV
VNRHRCNFSAEQSRARGFTLLEVMIALVILAIGVMGVIGLQMSTYKQLQISHNFSKAAMLASDMADRMLANQDQALAGAYTHDSSIEKPTPDCAIADCTAAQLAAYDVWYWQAELSAEDPEDDTKREPGALPMASGEVLVEEGQYIILVRWDDDLSGSTGTECAALDPDAVHDPEDLDCYALNLGCLSVACP